ncbi:hypothetical protein G9C98_001332 [Cotesia typhae]|uniref:Uncharacterized protein n=1 Tax=Cotesia typhae TaxID=2053667 RepID=A0A8J5V6E0_9HYME|nr:hypothetical protein G9C98_001332 [Cotesia typhae]
MPQKNKVPVLQELALVSIGKYIALIGSKMIGPVCEISQKNPARAVKLLRSLIQTLKHNLSSNVPWHLYTPMSTKILQSILVLLNETKDTYNDYQPMNLFLSEMNVIVLLIEVVMHPNLRAIEFSRWPKIMRHMLYSNLHNLRGLEVLDLGSGSAGWRTSDIEKLIINGVSAMSNLTALTLCFDCTDNIITALGNNCQKLRCLDVTSSRSVTDRSIPALLKCHQLRDVKLFRTSITVTGYADLLLGLRWLENIGRCDDIGDILEIIYERESNNKCLYLKSFESRSIITGYLYLLITVCPFITSLSIMCNDEMDNLSILSVLECLTELKLMSCNFYADGVGVLLEMTQSKIESLHLEHVDEIDRTALVCISQYCPRLKSLTFYNCDFIDPVINAGIRYDNLKVRPFKCLERIKCVADCAKSHLEFLLSHCTDIKFIQLGSSTGIDDTTMKKVFALNRMSKLEELKILYSSDLSMRTVRLLMKNCDNLRRLSELESWHGITEEELVNFRNELKIQNVNCDTIVKINLKEETFVAGKKKYERVKKCLENNFKHKFDVIVSWDPPEEKVCPSSVASWFNNRGHKTFVCHQKSSKKISFSIDPPDGDSENLFSWMDNLPNSINNSSELDIKKDILYIEYRGFFTRSRVMKILNTMKELLNSSKNTEFWGLHVRGFDNSPVSWGLKEHAVINNDGTNNYTVILKHSEIIIQKCLSSSSRPKNK